MGEHEGGFRPWAYDFQVISTIFQAVSTNAVSTNAFAQTRMAALLVTVTQRHGDSCAPPSPLRDVRLGVGPPRLRVCPGQEDAICPTARAV